MATVARQQPGIPWVLVLDDDPVAARATARAVSAGTGLRVAIVTDADSALRLALRADDRPVAAILDFDLSDGTTGLSVLMSLRASGCDAPCAFHTGAPDAARSALAATREGEGYPVFDKGGSGSAVVAWLVGLVGLEPGAHESGTRRRIG